MISVVASPASLWPLVQRLQQVFAAQRREVLMRLSGAVRTGQELSLTHWDVPMFDALRHIMAQYWTTGIARGRSEVDSAIRQEKGLRRSVRKDFLTNLAGNPRTFSLFNSSVLDAIDQATMLFCSTTNQTATTDLNTAIAGLRQELKAGVEQGEAYRDLGKRVQTLFADPSRARIIARTETDRALAHGSLISYEKSGVCEGSMWVATSNPCPACFELDGEERPFGEPFTVLTKGNPAYRVVMAPVLHVNCYCTLSPVLAL